MAKSERIARFVETLGSDASLALHPCYQGYFRCFNEGRYYEAHDVLEHLWLGPRDEHWAFYKGLIQIAGAFVHLQKQHLRPEHAKDGRRLGPACRLFALGLENVRPYEPAHLNLNVRALKTMCARYVEALEASNFTRNPWLPDSLPQLTLDE